VDVVVVVVAVVVAGCAKTPPAIAAASVRIRIVRVARVMALSISFDPLIRPEEAEVDSDL
jgi:hypothetical protein